MSRQPRWWMPGGIYHLTLRGNNRQQIFRDAHDYQQYLLELNQCRQRYPCRVLAFALMPNHVHLVIEVVDGTSPSDTMRQLGAGYTRYFNRRHQTVGHLYQGRFYSNHVDRDAYLLEVSRYVHLNPCRAHLVPRPADYLWSSYRIYLGLTSDLLHLVEPDRVLGSFGKTRAEQAERYATFVDGLAVEELEGWIRKLRRNGLLPPRRWLHPSSRLRQPVTVTS